MDKPYQLPHVTNGQDLWEKASGLIPGGNGLLSKRPERYAPDIWPTYFSRAKGIEVWDMDGNKYIDMAQMGIGTAILGYADDEVNSKVLKAIEQGMNTTLNAPEEVELAGRLLDLNPFAGSVKFARSGGEAMAIAVRIARVYSGKTKVAFSGYHGWCDWYLAANLSGEDNLKKHLLPGLTAVGVPEGLRNTAIPFAYNNIKELEKIICDNEDIGTIIIEGPRYELPVLQFLEGIKQIAEKKNIIVILDEITSGWRMTDGGVYKLNGGKPDMVVYGKAMGNGFAISAVLGKTEVMEAAQSTFISSTFWTERVGFVAALATIDKMKKEKVWDHLVRIGTKIGQGWQMLSKKHALALHITEFKPLITMKFEYGDKNSAMETLFIQEMLKRGYLAAPSVYVSYAHQEPGVDRYLEAVNEVFAILAQAIQTGTVIKKLETRIRFEGIRKLRE